MKRTLRVFPALFFVIFFFLVSAFINPGIVRAGTFAGGDGSQTNPYQVATCEQLQALQDTSGTNYYILAGDVNCSATTTWNGSLGFTPLTFSGHFDGRNHTIQNLYINDPATDEQGLFTTVTNSVIKNLKMTGANITGRNFTGGMIGLVSSSQISGVSFSGNVTGGVGVAGLAAGAAGTSTFSRCSVSGTITSPSSAVAGLIVLVNNAVTISDCYVNADLVGVEAAGLVGSSWDGPTVIERSYVAGSMLNSGSQTGFLGGTQTSAVGINNNLVVANMSAGSPAYFDTFNLDAPLQTGNYFDMKQTGAVDCGSSGYNNAECIGVSGEDGGGDPTYPFKNTTSVAPFTAWDFTTMWQVTSGYPTLRDAPLDPLTSSTSGLSDTLSREKVNTPSDHTINFTSVNGLQNSGDLFTINFGSAWDLSALSVDDLDLLVNGTNVNLDLLPTSTDTWGVYFDYSAGKISFYAPSSGSGYIDPDSSLQLLIGTNALYGPGGSHQITNPVSVSSYPVSIFIHNTVSGDESYSYSVPIIDNDQVNVTSYINTSIAFALHTGTFTSAVGGPNNGGTGTGANTEMSDSCTAETCFSYHHTDLGTDTAPGEYTVDLGNLVVGTPNLSNTEALHSDGGTGIINYIAFDLTSNAINGSSVAMSSQNGALTRANGTPDNWDIPSGSHGAGVGDVTAPIDFTTLASNAGSAYGFKFAMVPAYVNLGINGTDPATTMQNVTGCKGTDSEYCTLTIAPQTILTTGSSVQGLRATIALGALANGVNPAGIYRDTLTFIATATF